MYRDDDDPRLLITAFGDQVFAVDPETGATVWEYIDDDRIHAQGVRLYIDGRRVIGLGTSLFALDYATGEVLFRTKLKELGGGALLLRGERIYFASDGYLYCHSAVDGARLWKQEFKGRGGGPTSLGFPHHVVQYDS